MCPDKSRKRMSSGTAEINLLNQFIDCSNSLLICHIFPQFGKIPVFIPIPKKKSVSVIDDLRPVALTSVLMKAFESLVRKCLDGFVCYFQDQFQFAYR